MFRHSVSTLRFGAACAAFIGVTTAIGSAADTPTPVLTYLQRFQYSSGETSVSGSDYLQVDAIGDVRSVVPAPNGVRTAALTTPDTDPHTALALSGSCYRLSNGLLPTALQLSPGMGASGGELDVSFGARHTSVPVNFAARALTPQIERIAVSSDAAASVSFVGTMDIEGNVVLASHFMVATPATANVAPQVTTCQMNLMVPATAPLKTTSA